MNMFLFDRSPFRCTPYLKVTFGKCYSFGNMKEFQYYIFDECLKNLEIELTFLGISVVEPPDFLAGA